MQVAARGGGECARTGALAEMGSATHARTCVLITGTETNPITCFETVPWSSGCDAGALFFSETAQQMMFAQHLLLQARWLEEFEKMQDAAGSWSGITNSAKKTANRIATVFRITP
ncbi:MAG: hypothetical protein M3N48_15685 [Verrucomicrobiota bacterium]|nr:hypothetical protein [Verrucomicrobiota bacterium]